ncbi:MAG: hypothetical protein PHO71_25985, partial [Bacteroides sp.]|nr:hypothetical protein [Bacteroides sp.]
AAGPYFDCRKFCPTLPKVLTNRCRFFCSFVAENSALCIAGYKALTKGTIYPIVKKIAQAIGVKMTKDIFAKGVSKVIPVIGGVASGGLTYVTFRPMAYKLKKHLSELKWADPEFYKDVIYVDPTVDENKVD